MRLLRVRPTGSFKKYVLINLFLLLLLSACARKAQQNLDFDQWGIVGQSYPASTISANVDRIEVGAVDCVQSSQLCWQESDTETMKQILALEDQILLGRDADKSWGLMLKKFSGLKHKLNEEEVSAYDLVLTESEVDTSSTPQQTNTVEKLVKFRKEISGRVIALYRVAYTVPIGQIASVEDMQENLAGSKSNLVSALTDQVSSKSNKSKRPKRGRPTISDLSKNMEIIRSSGAFGKMIAFMLNQTGVLEDTYSPVSTNMKRFDEVDPVSGEFVPRGLSRQAKVDEIISEYAQAAGLVGLVTGAEAMIPIAGIPMSILHESYQLFRLHARMTFEIAAVYGHDIHKGNNLSRVVLMMLSYGAFAESVDILFSNIVVPLVVKNLSLRMGVELSAEFMKKLATRSLTQFVNFFTKKSQEKVIETVAKQGLNGIKKAALGWLSLGVSVFISGAFDYGSTILHGRHVAMLSRQWLYDLMLEGTTYLRNRTRRNCMFKALSGFMRADGQVTTQESRLYQAFLAKPYYVNDSQWFKLTSGERIKQSMRLKNTQEPTQAEFNDMVLCMEEKFQGSNSQHRLAILAHLYAMMQIDGYETTSQRDTYDRVIMGIDGRGWFDGSELNLRHLAFLEKSILLILNPSSLSEDSEYHHLLDGVLPANALSYLVKPDPVVEKDYLCGSTGVCQ
ncbi:MAG: hypothetical protein ISR65_13520 [Bacteriovoracaceae bacterium]|nr:hypothetical protein [Bacteriovoracaceae bacterium]